jgi:hypothetical protein
MDNRLSTRSHEFVILLAALGSQFNEYMRDSPLPERLTSLWCFAACYYCVRVQHYPVPARFISALLGSPLRFYFYVPEPTGYNTSTVSWLRWPCTSAQRDHSSSRKATATISLETLVSHLDPNQDSLTHDVPFRKQFGRQHKMLLAKPAAQLPSKPRHPHLGQQQSKFGDGLPAKLLEIWL